MALKASVTLNENTDEFWGVQYARQQANKDTQQRLANVIQQNEYIAAQNAKLLPEFHQALIPVPELYTDETFLQMKLDEVVNQMKQTMLQAAEQNLLTFAKSLPKEVLAQVIAQAGAPPLIES